MRVILVSNSRYHPIPEHHWIYIWHQVITSRTIFFQLLDNILKYSLSVGYHQTNEVIADISCSTSWLIWGKPTPKNKKSLLAPFTSLWPNPNAFPIILFVQASVAPSSWLYLLLFLSYFPLCISYNSKSTVTKNSILLNSISRGSD